MSVATRIWIQEIMKNCIFPGAGGLISSVVRQNSSPREINNIAAAISPPFCYKS
jgi:hypothetical protein